VLGITSIDPERNDLLFERFVSEERREPPDIDVDFEHERREEVMQWVYETYGRDHAALCSTVIRYRARGAMRDVGKALGLTEDLIKMLSSQVWEWSEEGVESKHAEELKLNMGDRRLKLAIMLAQELIGTPRHLSQHPGGFVLTHDRLDELVPIEPAAMVDRQVIEWDKDDIDALKFMKVDCLALGMLTAMKRAFDFLADSKDILLDLATIPSEDPSRRPSSHGLVRRSRQRRRARCRFSAPARPRRPDQGRWKLRGGSAGSAAARLADAGHLHPRSSPRHHQGEDEGLQKARAVPEAFSSVWDHAASAIQASASAPAGVRIGADGSLATRQIASATSDGRVIGPELSRMPSKARSIIGA
jgi:hypothetical protein